MQQLHPWTTRRLNGLLHISQYERTMMRIQLCDGEPDEVVKRKREWKWKRKQVYRANQQQAALRNIALGIATEDIAFGDGEVVKDTLLYNWLGKCGRQSMYATLLFSH